MEMVIWHLTLLFCPKSSSQSDSQHFQNERIQLLAPLSLFLSCAHLLGNSDMGWRYLGSGVVPIWVCVNHLSFVSEISRRPVWLRNRSDRTRGGLLHWHVSIKLHQASFLSCSLFKDFCGWKVAVLPVTSLLHYLPFKSEVYETPVQLRAKAARLMKKVATALLR